MDKTEAQIVIEKLNLKPHPEGGHYRQVFKDTLNVAINDSTSRNRSALTDIYFLLANGENSRFHRVKQSEIWHFYSGAPLVLYDISEDLQTLEIVELGKDLNFKYAVKANHWQAASTTGEFSLVGCTVAPGFEFEDFALLGESGDLATQTSKKYPNLTHLI